MMSPAEFAREIGLSRQAIAKAIRVGRVPVYDAAGQRVGPDYDGRKFVRPEEGRRAFELSRARIDDAALASASAALEAELAADGLALVGGPASGTEKPTEPARGTLVTAKANTEELKAELLRIRIERERGELVPRAAVATALETAGRRASQQIMALPLIAEELVGIAHAGGATALAADLRAKATAMATAIADALASGLGEAEADDVGEDDVDA